jgi:hypothetical protein
MSDLNLVWFSISTVFGTIFGLEIFRLLFRPAAKRLPLSTRLGCAFGGAFLGTFAGALLTIGYESLGTFPNNYWVTTLVATFMAVGLQKFHADQESQ